MESPVRPAPQSLDHYALEDDVYSDGCGSCNFRTLIYKPIGGDISYQLFMINGMLMFEDNNGAALVFKVTTEVYMKWLNNIITS